MTPRKCLFAFKLCLAGSEDSQHHLRILRDEEEPPGAAGPPLGGDAGFGSVRRARCAEVPRRSKPAAAAGAALRSLPGPRGNHRELLTGFHSRGGKHGQLHDSGEEPGAVPLPLLGPEARLRHEVTLSGEYIGHL